jgi:hypothetical protein
MKMTLSRKLGAAAMVAALLAPLGAQAESSFVTGAGALSTSASVDFRITIPRFLSLRVGPSGSGISIIDFTPSAAGLGLGGAVAGTGGDAAPGTVNVAVVGNVGSVTLAANTPGALNNGVVTNTIDWTQISTTASNPALPAPVLANGASATTTVAAVGGVASQVGTWAYSYANSVVPAAGTYGGVNANNGRVTYTATTP